MGGFLRNLEGSNDQLFLIKKSVYYKANLVTNKKTSDFTGYIFYRFTWKMERGEGIRNE